MLSNYSYPFQFVNFDLSSGSISSSITPQRQEKEYCRELSSKEHLSIAVRTAEIGDVECLAEILTQSFHPLKGTFLWLQPILKLGIYEDLCSRLKNRSPYYICLVAVTAKEADEEQIVGTIELNLRSPQTWLYHQRKDEYPYIANLAVSRSFRRRGVARLLLAKCDCIALSWGCRHLNLHVLEDNQCARALYYRSGYEVDRSESNWFDWLFGFPRRLLLRKKL
jgi:ribosomal protein S18 acetylase RimI-like enzyme